MFVFSSCKVVNVPVSFMTSFFDIFQGQCLPLQWWNNVCTASRSTLSWCRPSGTKFYSCHDTRSSHKWADILTGYSCWDSYAGTATPNNAHYQGVSRDSKLPLLNINKFLMFWPVLILLIQDLFWNVNFFFRLLLTLLVLATDWKKWSHDDKQFLAIVCSTAVANSSKVVSSRQILFICWTLLYNISWIVSGSAKLNKLANKLWSTFHGRRFIHHTIMKFVIMWSIYWICDLNQQSANGLRKAIATDIWDQ